MKNYCTSYQLYAVFDDGREFLCGSAFTKSTLIKHAKKLDLGVYCIVTYHTENLIFSIFKKEYFHD